MSYLPNNALIIITLFFFFLPRIARSNIMGLLFIKPQSRPVYRSNHIECCDNTRQKNTAVKFEPLKCLYTQNILGGVQLCRVFYR